MLNATLHRSVKLPWSRFVWSQKQREGMAQTESRWNNQKWLEAPTNVHFSGGKCFIEIFDSEIKFLWEIVKRKEMRWYSDGNSDWSFSVWSMRTVDENLLCAFVDVALNFCSTFWCFPLSINFYLLLYQAVVSRRAKDSLVWLKLDGRMLEGQSKDSMEEKSRVCGAKDSQIESFTNKFRDDVV